MKFERTRICHCERNEVKRGNLTTLGFAKNRVFSKPNNLRFESNRDCFVPRNDKSYYCHCERSAAERGNLATVGFAKNRVFDKQNKVQTELYRDCFVAIASRNDKITIAPRNDKTGNDKRG